MITGIIIRIISLLISLTSAILPAWRFNDNIVNVISEVWGKIMIANGFFPVTTCLKIALIILSFETTIFLARTIFGLISIIRGGGKVEI